MERRRPDAPKAGSFGRRVPRAAREDERRGGPRTRTRRFAERRPIRVAADRGALVRDPWGSRGAEVARRPREGHRRDAQRSRRTERGPEEVHGSDEGGKRVAIRPRPPQSLSRRPAIPRPGGRMGIFVIAAYRPKMGKERLLRDVLKDPLPILRKQRLVTDRPPYLMGAADGTFVEVFEWKSAAAIEGAHGKSSVQAMWAGFEEACASE